MVNKVSCLYIFVFWNQLFVYICLPKSAVCLQSSAVCLHLFTEIIQKGQIIMCLSEIIFCNFLCATSHKRGVYFPLLNFCYGLGQLDWKARLVENFLDVTFLIANSFFFRWRKILHGEMVQRNSLSNSFSNAILLKRYNIQVIIFCDTWPRLTKKE